MDKTRSDRIYCLKVSSDYHSEVCEECKYYPNCDHMTQDDMTEVTIKDLEKLEKIEQIVNAWNNDASNSFSNMCKINGILKEYKMDLRDLLYLLKEDADVCLKESDLKVTLGEASELLTNYTEDEDTYVKEIEPDGYVDSNAISYLTIHIAQREKDEEMPFK